MAFERNDIVVKTKLADALGETLMGFEHNDIVTTDVMNAAIAGGGGGGDFEAVEITFQLEAGLSTAYLYGFFIFNYGQEDEYSSADITVTAESTVHCVMYKGSGTIFGTSVWFEGDNISESGTFTGGGTVIIHENSD